MKKGKTCGHKGSKENPLGIQGNVKISYCATCLNKASIKVGMKYCKENER